MANDVERHQKAHAIGERLVALYRAIGDRAIRDLPIYNEALDVEAVGFRVHHGRVLGILITPWFMNIVSAQHEQHESAATRIGETVRHVLPSGAFDFIVGQLDGFGRIETCSLFSPMFDFGNQDTARAAASAALAALLDPDLDPKDIDGADQKKSAAAAIDRRRFLRGELREPRT